MRYILLACVCGLALVCSPAGAVKHGAPPILKLEVRERTTYLSSRNEALEKAMEIHNLMNELPDLEKAAESVRVLEKTAGKMERYMRALNKCSEKRFSGRFKNAGEVVKKVRTAYAARTDELKKKRVQNPNSIVPVSLTQQSEEAAEKRAIENELMQDVFKNARKWGGDVVARSSEEAPQELDRNKMYNLFEEMNMAEQGLNNAQLGHAQAGESFLKMQNLFLTKLADYGIQEPELNFMTGEKVNAVYKQLKQLKQDYLKEAKEYIAKLEEQDRQHPQLAERRLARSKTKRKVLADIQGQFPDVFLEADNADQMSPQMRQQIIVTALERDADGSVYLTETNASEIDQRMAEKRANRALINKMMDKAYEEFDANVTNQEIDLGAC